MVLMVMVVVMVMELMVMVVVIQEMIGPLLSGFKMQLSFQLLWSC